MDIFSPSCFSSHDDILFSWKVVRKSPLLVKQLSMWGGRKQCRAEIALKYFIFWNSGIKILTGKHLWQSRLCIWHISNVISFIFIKNLQVVSVCVGCSNKMSRLGVLQKCLDQATEAQRLVSRILEAGESRFKAVADFGIWWRQASWFIHSHLLDVSCMEVGTGLLSEVSFIRVLIPFMKTPPSQPH